MAHMTDMTSNSIYSGNDGTPCVYLSVVQDQAKLMSVWTPDQILQAATATLNENKQTRRDFLSLALDKSGEVCKLVETYNRVE